MSLMRIKHQRKHNGDIKLDTFTTLQFIVCQICNFITLWLLWRARLEICWLSSDTNKISDKTSHNCTCHLNWKQQPSHLDVDSLDSTKTRKAQLNISGGHSTRPPVSLYKYLCILETHNITQADVLSVMNLPGTTG